MPNQYGEAGEELIAQPERKHLVTAILHRTGTERGKKWDRLFLRSAD
jgi:hypothetical protein